MNPLIQKRLIKI